MFRTLFVCIVAVAALGLVNDDAFAAKKKTKNVLGKRSDYTSEQRAKIYEEAKKICKKKFGPTSRVQVNYATNGILCYTDY